MIKSETPPGMMCCGSRLLQTGSTVLNIIGKTEKSRQAYFVDTGLN